MKKKDKVTPLPKVDRSRTMPTNEAALRGVLVAVINETIPHLDKLRDKEWAMNELEKLKTNKIEGTRRLIKNTGIVRKVDDLGRMVVPMELRRSLNILQYDSLDISMDAANGWIVLECVKNAGCHFCGSRKDTNEFMKKLICETCMEALYKSV